METVDIVIGFLWSYVMLPLLISGGIYILIKTKGEAFKNMFYCLKDIFSKKDGKNKGMSPFSAFMTTVGATVGTGNIAGVAVAMTVGGPGSLFWMWTAAFISFSLKYAECALSVRYKTKNGGGPMQYLKNGIGGRKGSVFAVLFCIFAVAASFGIGNTAQVNTIALSLKDTFGIPPFITGIVITAVFIFVFKKGDIGTAKVSDTVVPIMSVIYIVCCLVIIFFGAENLGIGIKMIFESAFDIKALFGGAAGGVLMIGFEKGMFSNEAGMGTAGIALSNSSMNEKSAGSAGVMSAFLDTVVICTLTGLAVAVNYPYINGTQGIETVLLCFERTFGHFGSMLLSISMCLFAFASVTGWQFYGEKSLAFISKKSIGAYRIFFSLCAFFACLLSMDAVWSLSALANALMAIINILGLYFLVKKSRKKC